MATVISHFYNEEYLLPFWLSHHKKIFNDGIMIDYDSTDNSVDIIKEICPKWKVINSRNKDFGAYNVNLEIEEIEKNIDGWRIVLNTTEFLIGDLNKNCDNVPYKSLFIPSATMVCPIEMEGEYGDKNIPIYEQFTHGIYVDYSNIVARRALRIMCNYSVKYTEGRHYQVKDEPMPRGLLPPKIVTDLIILWYRFSPMNDKMIKRNLQIQERISEEDRISGNGYHHIINESQLYGAFKLLQSESSDIFYKYKHLINK